MNPESVFSFTGWARKPGRRARWVRICRAATREACWVELLEKAPPGWDKLAKRGDGDPNKDKL